MKTHITLLVVALATSIGAAVGQTPAQLASIEAKRKAGNHAAAIAEIDTLLKVSEYDPKGDANQNMLLWLKGRSMIHTKGREAAHDWFVRTQCFSGAASVAATPQQILEDRTSQLAQDPGNNSVKAALLYAKFSTGANVNADVLALMNSIPGYIQAGTAGALYGAYDPAKATPAELKAFYAELLKRTELNAQSAPVVGKIRDQLSKLP